MTRINKSDYIKLSRTLIKKLYDENCFGKGSLYLDTLKKGLPKEYIGLVEIILESLVKQGICGRKKKLHGWKYFLNMSRIDKIREIIKERGINSLLLFLF